jgi:hypothetical protein
MTPHNRAQKLNKRLRYIYCARNLKFAPDRTLTNLCRQFVRRFKRERKNLISECIRSFCSYV